MPDPVTSTLRAVTGALPGGGEEREGQEAMAEAVATAIAEGRHLVVQAGTGIGKSLAYLVPAALGGGPTVVATATKALQDQLADKDLPAVAAATDVDLTFAVLKGRSNYLCRQRLTEMGGGTQLDLVEAAPDPPDKDDRLRPARDAPATPGTLGEQVRRLVAWSEVTTSGDRAELDFEPHYRAWAAVSTSAHECPGAFRCPSGHECFAEDARHRAAESDVIVVNTHLYGAHLASGGTVLPPHRVVVFDEAHAVEDVLTDGLGVEIGPGRFRALAAGARALLDDSPAAKDTADAVAETADALETVLAPLVGHRLVTATTTDSEGDAARAPGNRGGEGGPARPRWRSRHGGRPCGPPVRPTARRVGEATATATTRRSGPGATDCCWPPGTSPTTWLVLRRLPTTRSPGSTLTPDHRCCGSRPSTSAPSWPSSSGLKSPAS